MVLFLKGSGRSSENPFNQCICVKVAKICGNRRCCRVGDNWLAVEVMEGYLRICFLVLWLIKGLSIGLCESGVTE